MQYSGQISGSGALAGIAEAVVAGSGSGLFAAGFVRTCFAAQRYRLFAVVVAAHFEKKILYFAAEVDS